MVTSISEIYCEPVSGSWGNTLTHFRIEGYLDDCQDFVLPWCICKLLYGC